MKKIKLQRRHIQTTADRKKQQKEFSRMRRLLGHKRGTHYRTGDFSIKWFENGVVLKSDRQQGVVFTMQQLRDINVFQRKEMMKEL